MPTQNTELRKSQNESRGDWRDKKKEPQKSLEDWEEDTKEDK